MAISKETAQALLDHRSKCGERRFIAELDYEPGTNKIWKNVYRCKKCGSVIEQVEEPQERLKSA